MKRIKKMFIINLIVIFCLFTVACDIQIDDDSDLPARYGEFGRDKANELATQFPERFPGSDQEEAAANWLLSELNDLGYEPKVQEFSTTDSSGNQINSQNIIVEISGIGFATTGDGLEENSENSTLENPDDINQRFIIIGTHYDTPTKTNTVENQVAGQADGIHNNAAGVGSLITLLNQMKNTPPGFDTQVVFFGASDIDYAGSRAFFEGMTDEERSSLEVMYNVDRIYAGDKVYAHSGVNSIVDEYQKSYEKRQKLYEITDVYYNNLLLTNNNFALYTNQNIFSVNSPMTGEPALFREWTTTTGDHTVFDNAGYPIVFLESFEYDVENYSEIGKESTDPYFAQVNGIIDRTNLDSSYFLNSYFMTTEEETEDAYATTEAESENSNEMEQGIPLEDLNDDKNIDRLERRINNIAFLLLECSRYAGVEYELK